MTTAVAGSSLHPDVAEVLARGLRERLGRRGRIADVRARTLGNYSSHPIWRLDVTLADGESLPVVFKDLRPARRKSVHREVLLYERLLAGGRFDAPLQYASLCDHARGRYWLFLEDVGPWRLEWCAGPGWQPAFRWMARMHAACEGRQDELRALDCLSEHDAAFYRKLAADARGSLIAHDHPGAAARFDRLAERFLEPSIRFLGEQPRTLVHGDLSCHNVMVQPGPRIRPVDWEWAAVGPGAWDVAKLVAGWGTRKGRFLAVYLDELAGHRTTPVDTAAFSSAVTRCAVMQRLWYLRWWIEPCREPAFVDRLLDKVERGWQAA
jgi:thiamine kinase-like enzyme